LTARQAAPSEVVVGPGARRGGCGDCGVSNEVALESLSYTASEVVGRDGSSPEPKWCGRRPSDVVWPKCNVSMKSYREGLSRLEFAEDVAVAEKKVGEDRGLNKVVCRSGERRWCDGRVEVVDATTQNRAKSKREQPETEHRDA
jgi:hypothetical protein